MGFESGRKQPACSTTYYKLKHIILRLKLKKIFHFGYEEKDLLLIAFANIGFHLVLSITES